MNQIQEGNYIHCKNEKLFKQLMTQLESMGYNWVCHIKPTKGRPNIDIKYCAFKILRNKQIDYSFLSYYTDHNIPVIEYEI